MDLDNLLKRVTVLGAAGKMGRGISLLLLQEMALLEAKTVGKMGSGTFCLTLIDANDESLGALRKYFHKELKRFAEKNINLLRRAFVNNPKLISNADMIEEFTSGAVDIIRVENRLEIAKHSHLIFEAIAENIDLKSDVLSSIGNKESYYFTNTSSIPIGVLSEKSKLNSHLIGFHFYNPPPIQKVLEIIPPEELDPNLLAISKELAKRFGKITVFSKDVAGFIGNGHFIREISFACHKVQNNELEKAIYQINHITQEFLIRPMGIFQLIDYVGVDVCHQISAVMNHYLKIPLRNELVETMMKTGHLGGLKPDGSQKEGFFQYEGNRPVAIYSFAKKQYISIPISSRESSACSRA